MKCKDCRFLRTIVDYEDIQNKVHYCSAPKDWKLLNPEKENLGTLTCKCPEDLQKKAYSMAMNELEDAVFNH